MHASSTSFSSAFSPLELSIRPSKVLPLLVSVIHLLALLVLPFIGLEPFALLVCGALVLLSCCLVFRGPLRAWRGPGVTGLSWYPDRRQFYLITESGHRLEVESVLLQAGVPGLVAMKLQLVERGLPDWLLITRDQLDRDGWRRLNLLLELAPPHQRVASDQG